MGRRVTSGRVGSAGLGSLAITSSTISGANNTDITVDSLGTGRILLDGDVVLPAQSDLRFNEASANGTNYVGFQAPASITADVLWTLPATDGTNDQVLATNGTGTLVWSTKSVTITDDTTTNATRYLVFTSATSGTATTVNTASTKMTFNPSTGLLTVPAITESSSITLKENIMPIEHALDRIMQLVGVTYDRKDGSRKDEAGLIAEDVNLVIPNIVSKNDIGNPESIQYSKLTAYLIEAVKTLKLEIDKLKGI